MLVHGRHVSGDRDHPQVNGLLIREAQRHLGAVRQRARHLGLGSPTVQMPVEFGDPVVDRGQLVGEANLVRRIGVDEVADRIPDAVEVGRHALAPPLQFFQLGLEKGELVRRQRRRPAVLAHDPAPALDPGWRMVSRRS